MNGGHAASRSLSFEETEAGRRNLSGFFLHLTLAISMASRLRLSYGRMSNTYWTC